MTRLAAMFLVTWCVAYWLEVLGMLPVQPAGDQFDRKVIRRRDRQGW